MNESRKPARQPINKTGQYSINELESKYNQVLEARDDDWKKWRDKEKELLAKVPAVVKEKALSAWDQYSILMGNVVPFIAPVVAAVYAWWDASSYPPPGQKFWTRQTVQSFFQSGMVAVFALMLFKRILAAIIIAMLACLMFVYLFAN